MNALSYHDPETAIERIISEMRQRGVRLWAENGQLRYRALKGALAPAELERLREVSGRIVSLLERDGGVAQATSEFARHRSLARAPLTYSQLSHWNWYHLGERRHIRQIAGALHFRGRLEVEALRAALSEVVRRQEALRTRIVLIQGGPVQEISERTVAVLEFDDLTQLPGPSREVEVRRLIEEEILRPVSVATDPLHAVRLLKLGEREYVLVATLEHSIADGFSLAVFLRDLFTGYGQAVRGHEIALPEIGAQFADFARWQSSSERSWLERNWPYWRARMAGCERLRFPPDEHLAAGGHRGWGCVPFEIEEPLKAALQSWCRTRHTTLVLSVLTAYAALIMRWCAARDVLIPYVTDGRTSPKLENTIGGFAASLPLRVGLEDDDNLLDLLERVKHEYGSAYEHADAGYIDARTPRPEFMRNASFNWQPKEARVDVSALGGTEREIVVSPVTFDHPMLRFLERDTEPATVFVDTDRDVLCSVYFPLNRFSVDTVQRFAKNILVFLNALLKQPETPVRDIPLVS